MDTQRARARDIEALTFIFVPSPTPGRRATGEGGAVVRGALARLTTPPVVAGLTLGVVLLAALARFLARS